jgi:phosphatidylinositol alpha-1,6-mannosyltransferase
VSSAQPIVLSECFPPVVGGSAELLWNIYSRLSVGQLQVLTGAAARGAKSDPPGLFRISQVPFGAGLGLIGVRPLAARVRTAWTLRRATNQSSIVHCGRVLPEGLAASIARRRFICWAHGEELPIIAKSRELSWLMRRVYKSAAALIANSRHTARLLADLGNPPGRIHVVHPGVDSSRFVPGAAGS